MEARFQAKKVEPTDAKAQGVINVYWHVIYSSTALSGGYIPYVSLRNAPYLLVSLRPSSCLQRLANHVLHQCPQPGLLWHWIQLRARWNGPHPQR